MFCWFIVAVLVQRLECWFLLLDWVNSLPHASQLYGFTPVWVRRCAVKLFFWANNFPHWSHLWFFSPVCVRMCVRTCVCVCWIRSETNLNVFPQGAHRNGESTVPWTRQCCRRDSVSLQPKEHWEHDHIFVTSKLFVSSSSTDSWDWKFELELPAVSNESQAVFPATY